MTKPQKHHKFAVCVANDGCDDLQIWKLYKVLPDKSAEADDYIRVVDESGEDYLYPATRFVLVEFALPIERQLIAATVGVT